MEAIRQAGGRSQARLRAVSTGAPQRKQDADAPPSGDLMAALAAKLSIRRKGISGDKTHPDWSETSGALAKVSALIPPPPIDGDAADHPPDDLDWS
ncbi:WASH complex subunit 1-like [Pollicipes pollicipes]|uniref:WASH complex subunit 1-like n=1 Tax=Pollicipes pollicipes TaxID=41117 RepID=UPI00188495C4|nr:WASH complex subunit 1-like [Pollicipes pollicipes]